MGLKDAEEYIQTVDRLEPDIHPVDAGAFYASAAVSLKRIADAQEEMCRLYACCTGQETKYAEETEYCVGCDKAVTAKQIQFCARSKCSLSPKAPIRRD